MFATGSRVLNSARSCFLLDADFFFLRGRIKEKIPREKKILRLFFCAEYFFLPRMPQLLEVVKKSVMGDSLGTCEGTWCVQGLRDGTSDVASLILTLPPLGLDFHFDSPISTFLRIPTTSALFLGQLLPTSQPAQLWVFNLPVLLRITGSQFSPLHWRLFELG